MYFDPVCIKGEIPGVPVDLNASWLGWVAKLFPIAWLFNGEFSVNLFFVPSGYVLMRLVKTDIPFNRQSKAFVRSLVSTEPEGRQKFFATLKAAWQKCT